MFKKNIKFLTKNNKNFKMAVYCIMRWILHFPYNFFFLLDWMSFLWSFEF